MASLSLLLILSAWVTLASLSREAPPAAALCLATSEDGLRFSPTGEVLVRGGTAPSLARLANDELLAVFEHASDGAGNGRRLYASRSKDGGKSWSNPGPVKIEGLTGSLQDAEVRSPVLLVMPSGLVRMYFVVGKDSEKARVPRKAMILSAVTRNGVDYRLDRDVRIPVDEAETIRLSACAAEKDIVLFAEVATRAGQRGTVRQWSSRDGRSFSPADRGRQRGPVGPIVQLSRRLWRMYLVSGGVVYSRSSSDGLRWRSDSGTCLNDALDAAVAGMGRQNYVMLFTRAAKPSDVAARPLVTITPPGTTAEGTTSVSSAGGQSSGESAAQPGSQAPAQSPDPSAGGFDEFTDADFATELGENWDAPTRAAGFIPTDEAGFAPLPDLKNHIDYISWFEQQVTLPPEQNAYTGYKAVSEAMLALPDEAFKDRYNSGEFPGPPAPWDPQSQPVWESCYQAQQDILTKLRTASQDSHPYALEPTWSEGIAPEDRTMWGILLPGLNTLRGANKANLSQAWRMEDGVVPPEQMREAIGTGLGLASHLQQGPTLIERMVGCANQNLTLETARWALQQGVFTSADDIQSALDVLQERGPGDSDPGGWIRFEHASTMDMMQYIFEPAEPGGEPALRKDRCERMLAGLGWPSREVSENMAPSPDDAAATIAACDGYWRELKHNLDATWPYAPPEDPDQAADRYRNGNELSQGFIPSIGRAYTLLRRAETSRRATTLTYSIELYRARNGRYPTSLDELPYEQVYDVRGDPFSGADFVYRLTDQGPLLYSAADNGVDDGGVHTQAWGGDLHSTAPQDHIFWPPQP